MSTYSSNLRIELITTGTQAGTWGTTTNDNLSTVLEAAIAGSVSVTTVAANEALTYLNGPSSTASANTSVRAILTLNTSTGANFAVYAPPVSKLYIIKNASSYTATIYNSTVIGNTTAAGTGVAIPAGKTMAVWSDGTDFVQQVTYLISPELATPTLSSPTMTGTPVAPTAAPGTNTTQVATTAFVQAAATPISNAYPVGSIYMNASNSTNPASLLGFGTWTALGSGRVLLGAGTGGGGTYTAGATGGSKDAIVVSHTHTATVTDPGHTHSLNISGGSSITGLGGSGSSGWSGANTGVTYVSTSGTNSATTGISVANSTTGSSGTDANLPPYLVVYMWQRTA
jgi:hypothetical protein